MATISVFRWVNRLHSSVHVTVAYLDEISQQLSQLNGSLQVEFLWQKSWKSLPCNLILSFYLTLHSHSGSHEIATWDLELCVISCFNPELVIGIHPFSNVDVSLYFHYIGGTKLSDSCYVGVLCSFFRGGGHFEFLVIFRSQESRDFSYTVKKAGWRKTMWM